MKGFWRTMESVLAVMIVMGFLVTAGNVYFASSVNNEPSVSGYEKLKELDSRGELRPLAEGKNFTAIDSRIDVPGYSHSVRICDFSGNCWGNYTDSQTAAKNVIASSYLIAGYGSYGPLEIRLYMWR